MTTLPCGGTNPSGSDKYANDHTDQRKGNKEKPAKNG